MNLVGDLVTRMAELYDVSFSLRSLSHEGKQAIISSSNFL
jgi:hypothetical protein